MTASLTNRTETDKALHDLRVQLHLINRSIRLMERVHRARQKRREFLPDRVMVACCLASARNNQKPGPTSHHRLRD
jgi:hypothetical protein